MSNGDKTAIGDLVISLDLSVDKVNIVLNCLGLGPFNQVASLIAEIKEQGDSQVTEYLANQKEESDGN